MREAPNSDGTSSRREERIDRSLLESCRGQPFRPHESGRGRREHFVDPSSMAGPLTAQASLLAVFGPKGHRQSCRDSQSPHPLEPFLDVVPERVLFTPAARMVSLTRRTSRKVIESPWPMMGWLCPAAP